MRLPDFDENDFREVDDTQTNKISESTEVGPYRGYVKVEEINDAEEDKIEEANENLARIAIAAVAALIIIGAGLLIADNLDNNRKKVTISKDAIEEYQEKQDEEVQRIIADIEKRQEEKKNKKEMDVTDNAKSDEVNATEVSISDEDAEENEFDYSGARDFYQKIAIIKENHPEFAESFQSEDDVKNLVDFIRMFNPLYKSMNIKSSIKSQEEFASIISEYYRSCVRYGIDAELYQIFDKDSLYYEKVKESEDLANDLKNGKGDDYTIANRYYYFMGENLVDGRTWIDRKTKNAPLIDLLRDQFEEYRYVGNMLEARTYQKNDGLAMPKIEIAHPYQDEVETEVFYDYLTCPDWGIDNVVSKSEEKTETDLVHLEDGQALFQMVDESFKDVLGRSR